MTLRLVGSFFLFLVAACGQPAGAPLSESDPGAGPGEISQLAAVPPAETPPAGASAAIISTQTAPGRKAEPTQVMQPLSEIGAISPVTGSGEQDQPTSNLATGSDGAKSGRGEAQPPSEQDIPGGPQVSIECGSPTTTASAPIYCGFQFQGSVEGARWSAPGGSPSHGNGADFQTSFPNQGQYAVHLEACGRLGCVTASNEFQVVGSVDQGVNGPTKDHVDSGEAGIRRDQPDGKWSGLYSLPPCSQSTLLTLPPLDQDAYQVIIPLGLLTTPQHVLPTSHIYYHLKRKFGDSGGDREANPPVVADVRAPGNIRILEINYTIANKDGELWYRDYDLLFAPCRDRLFELIHVSTLNPELNRLLDATQPFSCDDYGSVESRYTYCKTKVQLDITTGTVLGTTGGKVSAALDLEAYDLSAPPLAFANRDRYRSDLDLRLHVTCPLDGFTAPARAEQIVRMGGYDGRPRTESPVCGRVMQDVPGTAQGNWFTGPLDRPANWTQEMALVHDHVDPSLAAISIGGTVMEMGVWLFLPEDGGLINREFSQVVPDGRIYCYQGAVSSQFGQGNPKFPGRLLIRMDTEQSMSVERQDGPCQNGVGLVEPVVYQR